MSSLEVTVLGITSIQKSFESAQYVCVGMRIAAES